MFFICFSFWFFFLLSISSRVVRSCGLGFVFIFTFMLLIRFVCFTPHSNNHMRDTPQSDVELQFCSLKVSFNVQWVFFLFFLFELCLFGIRTERFVPDFFSHIFSNAWRNRLLSRRPSKTCSLWMTYIYLIRPNRSTLFVHSYAIDVDTCLHSSRVEQLL